MYCGDKRYSKMYILPAWRKRPDVVELVGFKDSVSEQTHPRDTSRAGGVFKRNDDELVRRTREAHLLSAYKLFEGG